MKASLACIGSLCLATVLVLMVGESPTMARWGMEGVRSLRAVAMICLGASFIGFLPVAVVSHTRPAYVGQAALGATALRLLLTLGGGGMYQLLAQPHLASFLFWAVVLYCVLLAIETGFSVYLARKSWIISSGRGSAVAR